jgi:PBP1b-binding outer membrane lipoprotein LpoB
MSRLMCVSALLAAALAFAGCASGPGLETRTYQLERPATEEAVIKGVISGHTDEIVAAMRKQGMVSELETVKITPDHAAIVKVTPATHRAIRKALDRMRADAAKTSAGT